MMPWAVLRARAGPKAGPAGSSARAPRHMDTPVSAELLRAQAARGWSATSPSELVRLRTTALTRLNRLIAGKALEGQSGEASLTRRKQRMPVLRKDIPEDGWNVEYFAAHGETLKQIAARYSIAGSDLQLVNYPPEGDAKLRIDIKLPADYALWLPSRFFSKLQHDVQAARNRARARTAPVATPVTTTRRAGDPADPPGEPAAAACHRAPPA